MTKSQLTVTRLYAFWTYDSYPYLLGGEVTKMLPNGMVEVKGYGRGFAFVPVKLLPLETGKAFQDYLNELKSQHSKAKSIFDRSWIAKADELLAMLNKGKL